ncbi:hypothetical protein SPFM15_00267 [Salmonella phage SPFM15]|nr:hypothetical protein SPFM5_00262 [Salmonella phage SPFM5]VFR13891.1 hypothetical protein SPFM15_00267 [Salmonella phage SPFM15]
MRYRIFISVRVQEVVDDLYGNVFPAGVEVETSWEFLKAVFAQDPDGMVAQIKMDLEKSGYSQSVVYRGNIKSLAYTPRGWARTPQEKARELMNHYTVTFPSLNLTGANMIAVGTLSM